MDRKDEGGVRSDSQVSGCCDGGAEMPFTELEKTVGGADLGVGLDQGLQVGCIKVEMPVRMNDCKVKEKCMNA